MEEKFVGINSIEEVKIENGFDYDKVEKDVNKRNNTIKKLQETAKRLEEEVEEIEKIKKSDNPRYADLNEAIEKDLKSKKKEIESNKKSQENEKEQMKKEVIEFKERTNKNRIKYLHEHSKKSEVVKESIEKAKKLKLRVDLTLTDKEYKTTSEEHKKQMEIVKEAIKSKNVAYENYKKCVEDLTKIDKLAKEYDIVDKESKKDKSKDESTKGDEIRGEGSKDEGTKGDYTKGDDKTKEKNKYNDNLSKYNMLLDMYNQDLETLYELHQKYENGETGYYDYESHADYMVGRYRTILEEYNKIKTLFDKEKTNFNPYKDLTDDELKTKLAELDEQYKSEYQFRAHEENGMEEHEDNYLDDLNKKIEEIKNEIDRRQTDQIKEPEKPEQPMMILEKGKGNDKNLPIRSFWEIYNDTCTEHAGSISTFINNMANMKILPPKEEDRVTKILSGVLIPGKAILKLLSLAPNAIMKTNKKLNTLRQNIDNLNSEEFQVLISSPDKIKEMYEGKDVKDSFDMDYLEPQFMKQYKVNDLYLRAVGGRLSRERKAGISYYNDLAQKIEERIMELDGKTKLTEDEKAEYQKLSKNRQICEEKGKELREEIDTFNDGTKKKSYGFKNIRGWFVAKFNPDNRDENKEMAELSKARREAEDRGDTTEVAKISNQMRIFAKSQNQIKGKKNNAIDRGKYSLEGPIEMLDRGEETRGRLLLANAAIVMSAIDLANQFRRAAELRGKIEQHNKGIEATNNSNTNIPVSGKTKLDGVDEARTATARVVAEGKFNRAERASLDGSAATRGGDWNLNNPLYKASDAITHADASSVTKAIDSAIAQGDTKTALNIAMQYAQKNVSTENAAHQSYMGINPQFDYSAIDFNYGNDINTILKFLQNDEVAFNTVVSGAMASTLQDIEQGINLLPAVFAGANALHQAERQGSNWRKNVKVKNPKKNTKSSKKELQKDSEEKTNEEKDERE